jgi:hypothetical protein
MEGGAMLKKFLLAAGLVAAFTFSTQVAEAKVKVIIGIGGYPNYCYDRYDPFHCGDYGYYPRYEPRHEFYDPYPPAYDPYDAYDRVSCDEARWMLRDRGYHDIRTNSCDGRYYVFIARKHHGTFVIKVSSRSGEIRSIRPL